MKLIGAGLPRTGTLSQKVGLEILGYGPCYHMVNVLANLDLCDQWRQAVDGDGQWDQIFEGFESTVDWPASFCYRELMETYPDAKVLLSVRESTSWARSMRETIWGVIYGENVVRYLSDARCEVDAKWRGYIDLMKEMWERSGLMEGVDTSEQFMADAMERYHEEVKATVPSDRLLVWSVKDGWEPLCEFLGTSVPEMPFPHLNDAKEFGDRVVDGALLTLQQWRATTREEPTGAAPSGKGEEPVGASSGEG